MGCDGSSSGVDPFALLGIRDDETDLEKVTSAFRSLVLLVHPDKGGSATDLKVVTCAYAFVKRALQDREQADRDFEAFCRDWKDAAAPIDANTHTELFDNAAFEADELPVYLGPEGPELGGAVAMAAGRGGHLGYTSEDIPLQPCQELVEYDSTQSFLGRGLHLYDYAEAYAEPPSPPPSPPHRTQEQVIAAFEQALAERRNDVILPQDLSDALTDALAESLAAGRDPREFHERFANDHGPEDLFAADSNSNSDSDSNSNSDSDSDSTERR
jgi:hypothetical protein